MTTSQPSNESELQLYRVLERANLLQYFDTFISQGGDDVQQFCEAGEEEFLEIMALVGMASKPLHVRRLQKALQEWLTNPAIFRQPVSTIKLPVAQGSIVASVHRNLAYPPVLGTVVKAEPVSLPGPANVEEDDPSPTGSNGISPSAVGDPGYMADVGKMVYIVNTNGKSNTSPRKSPLSPPLGGDMDPPRLSDAQMWAIESAARQIVKDLPPFEAKPTNVKRTVSKEIQEVMDMSDSDPEKIRMLRKYAAIYGRFDSKRKNEKRMSMHEVSVNEAAAQICRHVPTLLTRRNDLFPLARQVVRHSGYQYSKGHSRAQPLDFTPRKRRSESTQGRSVLKPEKLLKVEMDNMQRESRLADIRNQLSELASKQVELSSLISTATDAEKVQQLQTELDTFCVQERALITEQNEIVQRQNRTRLRYPVSKDSSSPAGSAHSGNEMDEDSASGSPVPSPSTSPNDEDTLFAEGLRIAQQYGMSDFAAHLKDLRGDDTEDHGMENRIVTVDASATALPVCAVDTNERERWTSDHHHHHHQQQQQRCLLVAEYGDNAAKTEQTDCTWKSTTPSC